MGETKFKGVVNVIEATKTFGQKGFRKRLVVLEQDNGRFSNFIPFEFIGDSCDSVDDLKVGDEIEVNYRLNGRKWQRDPDSEVKYFLSAEATGYRKTAAGSSNAQPEDVNAALNQEAYDGGDDVPF